MLGSRQKNFFTTGIWLHNHMATTQHKNPCLGSHEIYNFSRTILDYHQLVYTLFESCPREENFLRYTSISHFLPLNPPPSSPVLGVMESKISCLLTLQVVHTKFCKDTCRPSSSWGEYVNGWRIMDDAGRQPIAIDHPSH